MTRRTDLNNSSTVARNSKVLRRTEKSVQNIIKVLRKNYNKTIPKTPMAPRNCRIKSRPTRKRSEI